MAGAQAPFGPVVVRLFRCPDYVCQGRIVYRPAPEVVGFYEYHRWATDPRELITKYVADSLRSEDVFSQVATYDRGVQPAYLLAGSIDRLEEVDNGSHVQVVCALSAQLIDTRTGAVVWSDAASETLSVDQKNVAGVVRSLSSAVQATVNALMKSAARQMGSVRAAATRRTNTAAP
jgi:ABC-type uncharacterized transport system auxiliary subunit